MGIGFKRTDRVGDLILKEVSEMIIQGEIRDPRVSSVALTGVKMTDDLSLARLYFTVITGDLEKREALAGLERASGYIKRELGKRLRMRRIPELRFEFDSTLEEGYRIDDILREVKSE
ncbi:MAG: 30S ribosome-binding factor RbfA [Deltaproteobacteria bacterium]